MKKKRRLQRHCGKTALIARMHLYAAMVLFFSNAQLCMAYDAEITHQTLTAISVSRSRLAIDPTLLQNIDLDLYGNNQLGDTSNGIATSTIEELVRLGSVQEDEDTRPLNHFFDPQNDRPLAFSTRSPDWILNDNAADSPAPTSTYLDARFSLYNAFTLPGVSARKTAFAQTFKSLGHVLHHIQDMGQPQHTRHETHCNVQACKSITINGINQYHPSEYEKFTAAASQQQRILSGAIPTTNYSVQSFVPPRARDFWVNTNAPGSGMAEWVSENFLTLRNHIKYNPALGLFQPDSSEFPLPDGTSWNLVTAPCTVSGLLGQHAGTCDYVQATITDPITAAQTSHVIATKAWLFDAITRNALATGTSNSYLSNLFTTNDIVFENRLPILLPRIVSFSTGMLDYFFRGKIDLEYDAGANGWRIKNLSTDDADGRFQLFSDDSSGNRTEILSNGWDNRLLTIAGGQSSAPFAVQIPSGSKGLFLVFFGALGSEGQSLQDDLFNVTGQKVDVLSKVTISYGDNHNLPDDSFALYIDGVLVDSTTYGEVRTVDVDLATGLHTVTIVWTGTTMSGPTGSLPNGNVGSGYVELISNATFEFAGNAPFRTPGLEHIGESASYTFFAH